MLIEVCLDIINSDHDSRMFIMILTIVVTIMVLRGENGIFDG